MLVIRLSRTGRKAHAMYRVVVQESNRHPSSGRVVAYVGNYDPHTKEANLDKEVVEKYLTNGAQPTPRVIKLIKEAGISLPKWVKDVNLDKKRAVRNPEKLRKNQPKEAKEEAALEVSEPVAAEESGEVEITEAQESSVETETKEEKSAE